MLFRQIQLNFQILFVLIEYVLFVIVQILRLRTLVRRRQRNRHAVIPTEIVFVNFRFHVFFDFGGQSYQVAKRLDSHQPYIKSSVMQRIKTKSITNVGLFIFVAISPRFDVAGSQKPRFGNASNATGSRVSIEYCFPKFVLIDACFNKTRFGKSFNPFVRFQTDFFGCAGYYVVDNIILRIIRKFM